jgi:16S rRNA (guanine966-N2)-methyltransferase
LRVVAGIHKGRRLSTPSGRATRPTADRVRESVFDLLRAVSDERVLDLYTGSGALAIEALSRGAAAATLVDSDARALAVARANLERLGIENARVVKASVSSFLRSVARREERWSLVFCDPPYRLAPRLAPALDELLPPVLEADARVVCESSQRQPLELTLPLVTKRRYGDTVIAIYRSSQPEPGG